MYDGPEECATGGDPWPEEGDVRIVLGPAVRYGSGDV